MLRARCFLLGLGFCLISMPSTATPPQDVHTDYDTPPEPITITRPEYPSEAREKKIEGTVIVEITITTGGQVVEITL